MGVLTMERAKTGSTASARLDAHDQHEKMDAPMTALRWRFSVAEYHQMIAAGLFGEDDRLELLGGDLVMMSPIESKHAATVKRLNRILNHLLYERALIGVQDPLQLDEQSEPQPDLMVLDSREDDYATAPPTPGEARLVIEVSDTSADYDRDVKMHAYARAGIREAWLIELTTGWIEIYREPSPAGYKLLRKALPGETVSPLAFPDLALAVADVIR
jgi:Uma2 family endonuclease